MGEGGYFLLINATPYTWRKEKSPPPFQLKHSDFPDLVKPGTVEQVYIEFDQDRGKIRTNTKGEFYYGIDSTQYKFNVKITDEPSLIQVQLQGFSTPNNPDGSWLQLGWQHDGQVRFILSGKDGLFSSSNPPTQWMQKNLRTLGDRPLSQICMPGTHDAGMYKITHEEFIPDDILALFSLCQGVSIGGQLRYGSRYFDIRPIIGGGEFWTGHYNQGAKMGARGEKITDVVNDINKFTENNKELIFLNLSHAYNTDADYENLNQKEWNRVFKELAGIKALCKLSPEEAKAINKLPLNRFIGNGEAAVVLIVEPDDIKLGEYANHGFFTMAQFNVQNEYSNTDDAVNMIQDQTKKLDSLPPSDPRMFLLSWTLTPQAPIGKGKFDIAGLIGWASGKKSVKILAYSANTALFREALPYCKPRAMPNIVYVDFLDSTDFAALAMAINDKCVTNL